MRSDFGQGLRRKEGTTVRREQLEAILQGELDVDLVAVELIRRATDHAKAFAGAGTLFRKPDGRVAVKVYSANPASFRDTFATANLRVAEIIPDDFYFDLVARDLWGNQWRGRCHYPNVDTGPGGSVMVADVDEAYGQLANAIQAKGARYTFAFPHAPRLFSNDAKNAIAVNGVSISLPAGARSLVLQPAGLGLRLSERDTRLVVQVTASELPQGPEVAERIVRSLELLLGFPLDWYALVEETRTGATLRIDPLPVSALLKPNRYPAVPLNRPEYLGDAAALFARYFDSLSEGDWPNWPDPVISVRQAVSAMNAPLDVMALGLSVAVEGLLSAEFKDLVPGDQVQVVAEAQAAKAALEGLNISESTKKRLRGAIDQLNSVRAVDRLRALEQQGLISEAHRKGWHRVRNQAAHGARLDASKIDEMYRLCLVTLALLHRLIFLRIGYQERYIDYARTGWPEAKMDVSLGNGLPMIGKTPGEETNVPPEA